MGLHGVFRHLGAHDQAGGVSLGKFNVLDPGPGWERKEGSPRLACWSGMLADWDGEF